MTSLGLACYQCKNTWNSRDFDCTEGNNHLLLAVNCSMEVSECAVADAVETVVSEGFLNQSDHLMTLRSCNSMELDKRLSGNWRKEVCQMDFCNMFHGMSIIILEQ